MIDLTFECWKKRKACQAPISTQRRRISERKQDEFFENATIMLEHLLGLETQQKSIKEISFLFGANHLNPKEIWRFEIGDWNQDTPTKKAPLSIISKLPQKSEKWTRPRGKLMLIIRTTERIDDENWCEINGYARDKKSSNIMSVSVVSTHETFDDPLKPTEEEFYYILECTARIFYT